MKQHFIVIVFSLAFIPACVLAQSHVTLTFGSGMSYVKQKNTNKTYLPIVRPDATAILTIPIVKNFALQTGLGYHMKGYSIKLTYDYTGGKTDFVTKTRMHYLSVPILVSYKAYDTKQLQFWIDAGMNYDFFMGGTLSYVYSNYDENNNLSSRQNISYNIKGRFAPSKLSPTENTYDVEELDVAFKLQLRLLARERYSLSIYHINSLYDIRANPDDAGPSSLKYRYTGVSLGLRLF